MAARGRFEREDRVAVLEGWTAAYLSRRLEFPALRDALDEIVGPRDGRRVRRREQTQSDMLALVELMNAGLGGKDLRHG